jgi:Ca2+-binding EF-hand superfamily protein
MNEIVLGSIVGSMGAVLGAAIASIVPVVTSFNDFKKWKLDKRIQLLKEKRQKLDEIYSKAYEKITEAAVHGSYDIQIITSILKQCPKEISEAFTNMILDKDNSDDNKRHHIFTISSKMKEHITSLDAAIERAIE